MLDRVRDRLADDEVSGRFDLRRNPLPARLNVDRDRRLACEIGEGCG